MKTNLRLLAFILLCLIGASPARSASILQSADGTIAFEADTGIANISNNTNYNYWISTNDATAKGGTALYCATSVSVATANGHRPSSFVTYNLNFNQAGTYYVYYRWRADAAVVAATGDNFQGNSCFFGQTFGTFTTPLDQSTLYRLYANQIGAPASEQYQWNSGGQDAGFTPPYPYTVAAPGPQVLSIGDREWGFFLDRIVISTNSSLTSAQLDAIPNSLTDIVAQDANASYIAFEADRPAGAGATYLNNSNYNYWISTNDSSANGGTALYCATAVSVATANAHRPSSFVTYNLNFNQAGTYYVYYRWRADAAVVAATGDNFQGNSCFFGQTFGTFTTPLDQSTLYRLYANQIGAPASEQYQWNSGGQDAGFTPPYPYTVAAPGPQVLSIGDREWGFFLDRIVISTNSSLTGAQLDGMADSGGLATAPTIKSASGGWGNTTVTITFSDNVDPVTGGTATNYTISGLTVSAAAIGPAANQVTLTTSSQTQGAAYTVLVSNVRSSATGLPIAQGSPAAFTAWKLAQGWSLLETYLGDSGAMGITNLESYSNGIPNSSYYVKGFQDDRLTDGESISVRLTTIFTPGASDDYNVYGVADQEGALFYSTDLSSVVLGNYANTPALINVTPSFSTSPGPTVNAPIPPFSTAYPFVDLRITNLTAGTPVVLQAILVNDLNDAYLKLALVPHSDPTSPEQLSTLGGTNIAVWVDPSKGKVTFTQQPASTTAATKSRATFTVKATSAQSPLFYQWRSNGVDIVGATRPVYITPVVDASYNGATYSVVVSVAGTDTVSSNATLTVVPGVQPAVLPYVGIQFVGGQTGVTPAPLTTNDVAGVVRQENWNVLYQFNFDDTPGNGGNLIDAQGNPSNVQLDDFGTPLGLSQYISGTKANGDADSLLMEGYVQTAPTYVPLEFTLNQVPTGTYNLIAYSVGFSFDADFRQIYSLTNSSGSAFPTYYGTAQTGPQYNSSRAFTRISNTNPASFPTGNYVEFDGVDVNSATSDTLTLTVTPQSGISTGQAPPVNALQLVLVVPSLTIIKSGNNVNISWPNAANGFVLESSPSLTSPSWSIVGGSPNPITGAGSLTEPLSASRYYRLHKP